MSWVDLLLDSKAITAIYGEHVPSLDRIDLHELRLERRGGALFLDFDLAEFPAAPPKKWLAQDVNAVHVELEFFEVISLELEGWGVDSLVDLKISRNLNGLIELFCSEIPSLRATAEWVVLRKISAYHNERR